MDCSLPGSSIHGILQADWSGLPCPSPGDLPNPGIEAKFLMSHALAGGFFTTSTTWEAYWPLRSPLNVQLPPNFSNSRLCLVSQNLCCLLFACWVWAKLELVIGAVVIGKHLTSLVRQPICLRILELAVGVRVRQKGNFREIHHSSLQLF